MWQIHTFYPTFGFLSKVYIDEENHQKPGLAILWRTSVPLTGVVNLLECRLQIAELGQYRILNCYAPSGSENKHSRSVFYGEEIFKYLRLHSGAQWLLGGDHNSVIRREDVENGVGFSSKNCEALENLV